MAAAAAPTAASGAGALSGASGGLGAAGGALSTGFGLASLGFGISQMFAGAAQQGGAASELAKAQFAQAQAELARRRDIGRQAAVASAPTAQELETLRQRDRLFGETLEETRLELARQRTIASEVVDPTVRDIAFETRRLLKGEESRFLEPLRREQNRARANLRASLTRSLGADFALTSAGRRAVQAQQEGFSSQLIGEQRKTLSQLGTLGTQFASIGPDITRTIGTGFGLAGQISANTLAARNSIANRQLAGLQTALGAETSIAGMAGGQFLPDIFRGRVRQQVGAGFAQMGAGLTSQGLNRIGGGKGESAGGANFAGTQGSFSGTTTQGAFA